MSYTVQFIGLVCFLRGRNERHVLFPDGRKPGHEIDPQYASIVVARNDVESAAGWKDCETAANGIFELEPCSISIEGADVPGPFDTSRHDGRLPQLKRIDPNFEIDLDRAQTIARMHIRCGNLTAYRHPGGDAVISQLDVPHDGSIGITVTPSNGSPVHTIRLRPGTEIALANTARGYGAAEEVADGHFRIYEKLSSRPVTLAEPLGAGELPRSASRHAVLLRDAHRGLSTSCSNTGCCDP